MRRIATSLGIATVLVLSVIVFFGSNVAAKPEPRTTRDEQPPALVEPVANLESAPREPDPQTDATLIKLRGTIDQLPPGGTTGTWIVIDEGGTERSVEVTEQTRVVPPHAEPQPGQRVQVLAGSQSGSGQALVAHLIVIQAQGPGPANPVEFHGPIETLPSNTEGETDGPGLLGEWVVAGFTVTVDERTMIHPHIRTPEVGMRANVIAFEQEDGTLWAKTIALHAVDTAEFEFEGPIESLPEEGTLGTWIVDGIMVAVVETTTLKGATPAEGLIAEVKGSQREDGSVLATEIWVEEPEHDLVEFTGQLVVFADDRPSIWVIKTEAFSGTQHVSVTVTADTCVKTHGTSLATGVRVEVRAVEEDNGSLLAIRIAVEDDVEGSSERQFGGLIEQLPPEPYHGIWVVNGVSVTVSDDTDVRGAFPAVGRPAHVEGEVESGVMEGEIITVQGPGGAETDPNDHSATSDPIAGHGAGESEGPETPPSPPVHTIKLRGTVDQMPTDGLTGTWTIIDEADQARIVKVTEETRIVPPTADPHVGDWTEVLAQPEDEDGGEVLVAKQMLFKSEGPNRARPTELHGQIEALPAEGNGGSVDFLGEWVVAGFTFTVDSRTMVHPDWRRPEVGMRANVIAFEQEDGSLWAKNIVLHSPGDGAPEVEVEGPIQDLPEPPFLGTWTVDGFTVTVTDTTQLKGATPALSLTAKVRGEELEDGSILAYEIIVEGPEHEEVEFEGELMACPEALPAEWVIETETASGLELKSVTVTSDTYINENHGPVEVGAWVEVKALLQEDDTLLAVRIKAEDDDREASKADFEGTIDSLPPEPYLGSWIVAGINVTVTEETTLKGASPAVGREAEVEGTYLEDGGVVATRIKVECPEYEDTMKLEGTLLTTSTIPGTWVIDTEGGQISFTVDLSTTIVPGSEPIEPGIQVEVRAVEEDGSLVAVCIKALEEDPTPPEGDSADLEGSLTALPPSAPHSYEGHWTVEADGESVTAVVRHNTWIDGEPQVGDTIHVVGVWLDNGWVQAESIDVP